MKVTAALFAIFMLAAPKVHHGQRMKNAAEAFLASLDSKQREATVLPADSADRTRWTYVPAQRLGISWKEMTEVQRSRGLDLLRASLSEAGFSKIEAIRALEPILAEMENGNADRDPGKYWFMFFGEPGKDSFWTWRYEGHHISLTFALEKDVVVGSTPQFLGSNPATVFKGERKGERVLAAEQDLGFKLIESLDPEQRQKAIVSAQAPVDIVTGSAREAVMRDKVGITYKELSEEQQLIFREILSAFSSVQTAAEQKRRLGKLEKEGYSDLVFAWLGPTRRDGRHYYRIQGETFVIEYDNTQSDGNHIHTVWRDYKGDFGNDTLAEHYQNGHHKH